MTGNWLLTYELPAGWRQQNVAGGPGPAPVLFTAGRWYGTGRPDEPLSLLTLALSIHDLPSGLDAAPKPPPYAAEFELTDPGLTGYLAVARWPCPLPGADVPVPSLLIQVTGVAAAARLAFVLSAVTADPTREVELAVAAVTVARSVRLSRRPAAARPTQPCRPPRAARPSGC